jgi:thiamine-phosphate diphosphorylase
VTLPRLHVVTGDAVLGRPGFLGQARSLLETHGPLLALHLRGHGTTGAILLGLAEPLAGAARGAGALLLINDRVDVALAVGCGAQLGRRSIPVVEARALLGRGPSIGYSAHAADEAASAIADGADFVLVGTIWPSRSHPGGGTAGPELVAAVAAATAAPVLAIGGVTPERTGEVLEAGGHGVAVLSGVWDAADPLIAAGEYLEAMRVGR